MKATKLVSLAAITFLCTALDRASAQLSYSVTDLGTLGGNSSAAGGVSGGGHNLAGMVVGTSMAADNSQRAFLYTSGQMFDLNALCDLSTSDFNILTVASSISDSCEIIGQGITKNGETHAFLLRPVAVDGGSWSYRCCQWVWIQEGGGWWWETGCGCYKWHGGPGRHTPCPPRPPHCWWWPLPCPPECGCTPPDGGTPPPPPPPNGGPPTIQPPTLRPPVGPPTLKPPTLRPPTIRPPTLEPPMGPPTIQPPTLQPPSIELPLTTTLQPQPPTIRPPTMRPPTTKPPTLKPPTVELPLTTSLQPQTPNIKTLSTPTPTPGLTGHVVGVESTPSPTPSTKRGGGGRGKGKGSAQSSATPKPGTKMLHKINKPSSTPKPSGTPHKRGQHIGRENDSG